MLNPIPQLIFDKEGHRMIDKDEVLLSKQVGLRLAEARKEFCKLSQQQAAELLGIHPDQLRAMEEGLSLVPLSLIKKAAEAFAISACWILGLVADDWELDIETRRERDFLVALEKLHLESRAQQVAKQVEQDNKLAALSEAVTLLSQAVQAIDDSFMAFWAKNEEFTDMAGGSSVLGRIDQGQAAARRNVKPCSSKNLADSRASRVTAAKANDESLEETCTSAVAATSLTDSRK